MEGNIILTKFFKICGHQEKQEGPLVFLWDIVQLAGKLPGGSEISMFGQVKKG